MAKELHFVCPQCGCLELDSIEQSIESFPVESISTDKKKPVVYGDSGDTIDHWKSHFACHVCGTVLEHVQNYKTYKVQEEKDLVKWIKEHCPQ